MELRQETFQSRLGELRLRLERADERQDAGLERCRRDMTESVKSMKVDLREVQKEIKALSERLLSFLAREKKQ